MSIVNFQVCYYQLQVIAIGQFNTTARRKIHLGAITSPAIKKRTYANTPPATNDIGRCCHHAHTREYTIHHRSYLIWA